MSRFAAGDSTESGVQAARRATAGKAVAGRRSPPLLTATAVVLATAVLACAEPSDPLLGEWVSLASGAGRTTYIFEEGGRSRWVLELEEAPDTFLVDYRVDYHRTPIHLDVGPWASGPLAGRTLFGIVQMQGPDRFRVDFEPADPDGDGTERPASFSNQAVTYVRKLN